MPLSQRRNVATSHASPVHNQCTFNAVPKHTRHSRPPANVIDECLDGPTACALQSALRLSNEVFATRLGVAVRTVAAWHQKPDLRPKSEMQQLLDTALAQASDEAQARFAQLAGVSPAASPAPHAERRLAADPTIGRVLDWLDTSACWRPGTARRKVSERTASIDLLDLHDRGAQRSRADQRHIAHSLRDYYAHNSDEFGTYGARYDHDGNAQTSVLTSARWLDLECPLTPENDRLAPWFRLCCRTGGYRFFWGAVPDTTLDAHACDHVAILNVTESTGSFNALQRRHGCLILTVLDQRHGAAAIDRRTESAP
jgi:DNA-binding transcriptional regulator YiaG